MSELFARWQAWSVTADRSEQGWESDFPEWVALIAAAAQAMREPDPPIEILEACWDNSQCCQELADDALDDIAACWPALQQLAESTRPGCRWQVYYVASAMGPEADALLRHGLADPDSYARRRALLALANLHPPDAQAIAEPFLSDADPYFRQAAIQMVLVAPDHSFRARVLGRLRNDPVAHVRAAAEAALLPSPS